METTYPVTKEQFQAFLERCKANGEKTIGLSKSYNQCPIAQYVSRELGWTDIQVNSSANIIHNNYWYDCAPDWAYYFVGEIDGKYRNSYTKVNINTALRILKKAGN